MGLLSSSSSRQSSTVNEYNFANYGAAGAGAPVNLANLTVGSGKGSQTSLSITTADYGAIQAGRDLAKLALDNSGKAFEQYTAGLQSTTQTVLAKSLDIAKANQTPESSQLLDLAKQVGIGIAVALAVGWLAKGLK